MVQNHDETSFVTWAQTLHPESAATTIDPRFQERGSPWSAMYNDTISEVTIDAHPPIPVAIEVVAVDEPEERGAHSTLTSSGNSQHQRLTSSETQNTTNTQTQHQEPPSHHLHQGSTQTATRLQPWRNSNLLDLIFGLLFSLATLIVTIKLEFMAFVVYTAAAGLHYVAEEYLSSMPCIISKSTFLLVTSVLMVVDSILLILSVFVTEILGFVALLLCTLFGGPRSGQEWHQFIRRFCHLTRWAFRGWHTGWKPERVFPIQLEQDDGFHAACPHSPNNGDEEDCASQHPPFTDGDEPFDVESQRSPTSPQQSTYDAASSTGQHHAQSRPQTPSEAQARAEMPNQNQHQQSQQVVDHRAIAIPANNVLVVDEQEDYVKNTLQVHID